MPRDVILSKSKEPPFYEIDDLNPFMLSFPLFASGEIFEDIKPIYIVALDMPLIYYEIKAENVLAGFDVLFSKDKITWSDKIKEKGNPIIIDGTGNYAYLELFIKVRFHDTLDFQQIGTFKNMKLVLTYA